jgi:long-chain acyl-CoA synthetase
VIVSNAAQLKKILAVWDQLPDLKWVITMNPDIATGDRVVSMKQVMEMSRAATSADERRSLYQQRSAAVAPDDLLTLIYTSGTTGNPKGVMLTHRNLISNVDAATRTIALFDSDVLLSYLPMCHSYERMAGYYLAYTAGCTVYIAESIESVAELMREIRPTIMTSVPRLFERIQARVMGAVERDSPLKQKIFAWALRVGAEKVRGSSSPLVALQYRIADKLVFSKIRDRVGGRLRFFVSGGAALSVEVGTFFQIMGIRIVEGYGLTETSPVIAVHRLEDIVLGTVGQPLDNVSVRIADDGEILARGPNIMKGYWNDEQSTRETIDADGWLHTGDIGEIDARGHLRITDRKKNLFVSSGGKNIAPQPIEALVQQSPFVDQIMLIGDGREYCTALIVPDMDVVRQWAANNGMNDLPNDWVASSEDLHRAIEADLSKRQRELSKYERVRRFRVLNEPFTVDNGLMTPTLKVKRKAVAERYALLIEELYA